MVPEMYLGLGSIQKPEGNLKSRTQEGYNPPRFLFMVLVFSLLAWEHEGELGRRHAWKRVDMCD